MKPLPGVSPLTVWLTVPATVVRGETSPKLLANGNVPFPFTEFFTTVMEPVGAAAVVKVQT